ncbi:MAG: FAD-dependent protein [Bacteroidota bacterium]
MPQSCTIKVRPEALSDPAFPQRWISRQLKVHPNRISGVKLEKRSIDARKNPVKFLLRYQVWVDEVFAPEEKPAFDWPHVADKAEVIVVGLGSAGLFAALELIRQGLKPVVIERGKPVRERRRDLAKLTREGIVNPESNYCFGEGGAGTFSDGKLYTRSTKRGDTRTVLETLTHFGATEEILIDAHPHIGTNKLPAIIQAMREQILASGGEIHFETKLTDLEYSSGQLKRIQVNGDQWWDARAMILATGHSARDIFEILDRQRISFAAKSFALGVRVEHPQALIDQIQYHVGGARPENLPAASYSLVTQVESKGVYSFCMCPGGIICPAATAEGEVVVNGWSPSKRNSAYANSGMVVEVSLEDLPKDLQHSMGAMAYQKEIEQRAFVAGGGKQVAPAQRLTDFLAGKVSQDLPDCSYLPGLNPVSLKEVLPKRIGMRLQRGLAHFGKRLRGYISEEAVVVGVESRTSSPVRIPRDQESLMHPEVAGLFPCGEGAGYAGGIMSAAIDGIRVSRAVKLILE